MATVVLWVVVGAVFALWVWIAVRLVRRRSAHGTTAEAALRAEVERGLRELQNFLVRH